MNQSSSTSGAIFFSINVKNSIFLLFGLLGGRFCARVVARFLKYSVRVKDGRSIGECLEDHNFGDLPDARLFCCT
jgi:hypothetical protein